MAASGRAAGRWRRAPPSASSDCLHGCAMPAGIPSDIQNISAACKKSATINYASPIITIVSIIPSATRNIGLSMVS